MYPGWMLFLADRTLLWVWSCLPGGTGLPTGKGWLGTRQAWQGQAEVQRVPLDYLKPGGGV